MKVPQPGEVPESRTEGGCHLIRSKAQQSPTKANSTGGGVTVGTVLVQSLYR